MNLSALGFVLALLGGTLLVYVIYVFNRLVTGRNACVNARASIDVNLTRRHQLIPNLVTTVRGYMAHERTTLEAVTRARSAAMAQIGTPDSPAAEAAFEGHLTQLIARMEDYPELKADELCTNLMKNLTEAEEQISASRRAFNGQVMAQNNLVQQFPTLLVANLFGFTTIDSFRSDTAAQVAPAVRLDAST